MMSKLIKSALKSAKGAIQNKDYETGLKHSQSALDLDANNYLGLFFAGFCLAELKRQNEALERYKLALTVDGNHSQTHQGIVKLFTNHWTGVLSDENLQNLTESYDDLLKACPKESEDKRVEYVTGLCSTMHQWNKTNEALDLLKKENEDFPSNIQLKLEILKCVQDGMKMDLNNHCWVLTPLKEICLDGDNFEVGRQEQAFQVLLNVLKKEKSLHSSEMDNFTQICLKHFSNLELVRDVSLEILLQKSDCGIEWSLFDDYSGKYEGVVHSHKLKEEGKLEEAMKHLKKAVSSRSNFVSLWVMLSDLHLKLNQYPRAEQVARAGLQACKKLAGGETPSFFCLLSLDDAKLDLTYNLAVSLSGLENKKSKEMAVTTFEMMLKSSSRYTKQVLVKLVETLIELDNLEKVKGFLDKAFEMEELSNTHLNCLRIQLLFLEGNCEVALEEIEALTKADPRSYLAHFLHGQFMWKTSDTYKKDKKKCLNAFLNAAKLNVKHDQTFLYLGHYYSKIANDKSKALKLYQKAYGLSPGRPATGVALADVFIALGKVDLAIQLYRKITENSATGTCKWAWFRLGLCHLKNHEGDDAIKCFQAALRADSTDHICWECLGEGYVERGSYPSAWKSFERARELNPDSVFAVYQKAVVNQLMYLFHDAVSEFEEALKIRPKYVPALKGLAESHLSIARQMLQQGRDKTCIYRVNLAIEQLSIALGENSSLSCLWRLLADSCSLVDMLTPSIVQLIIPRGLTKKEKAENSEEEHELVTIGKTEALELSTHFYLRALTLCENNAVLMNDLGFSYFRLASFEQDADEARNKAVKSLQILKKAATKEPHNHLIWNNLGLVASSKFCENKRLAQHCFIKSVKCEANNWIAWCNLGVLYLTSSDAVLANKAFHTAQSLQPSYINSWIGQALIAENVERKEAMDLFRHSTELSYHDEAIAGYTWWVCHTIAKCSNRQKSAHYKESIGDMKAIIAAIPYIRIYCKRHPHCSASWTALGFLLEQDKLYLEAEKAYEEAHRTADTTNQSSYTNILINYARLLSFNSKHEEALVIARKLSHDSLEFGQLCSLAFVHSRAGANGDATRYYTKAIEVAPTEKELKESKLALALHLWKYKEHNQAKEMFQQLEAYGWLCATAILEDNRGDLESICWVMNSNDEQVKSFFDQSMEIYAVEKLKGPTAAIQHLQRLIERSPESWQLQHLLTRISRRCGSVDSRTLASSANQTVEIFNKSLTSPINHHMSDTTLLQTLDNDFSVNLSNCQSFIASDHHCRNGRNNNRLKQAQRLAHRHPYCAKSWTTVAVAAQADSIIEKISTGTSNQELDCCIDKMFTHVANCSDDEQIKEWVTSSRVVQCMTSGNHEMADKLLEKLSFDKRGLYDLWRKCAEKGADVDVEVVQQLQAMGQTDEYKKIVPHILQNISRWDEAFEMMTKSANSAPDWLKIVKLSLDAAVETGDNKLWISERGSNACENLADSQLPLANVLDGLVKRKGGNYRKSRYLFSKVFKPMTENLSDYAEPSLKLATWYLYRGYVEKKDPVELEKLCEKWKQFDEESFVKISQILSLS